MEKLIEKLLKELELDLEDPNLKETPQRVTKALLYATRGYREEARKEIEQRFSTKFPTKYRGMVVQKDLHVFSMCPHHLKDIEYYISFGIIYRKEALGLSMIYRIIKLLSARLVLQEDLTQDIVNVFNKHLEPRGIAVVIKGYHNCMKSRGIEQSIPTITTELTGPFEEDAKTRQEFFNTIRYTWKT